jgi:spermidine/putrescine transport system ATP-binding protein
MEIEMAVTVEFDQVGVSYGSFNAVKNANLTIEPGEFFSFLGPSGCGKTTLLRTVSGFTEPTAGTVRIGGKDMRGIGPNQRPTALIFQNLALFPFMTVAENIGYGLRVRGVGRSERDQRVRALLNQVALAGQGDKRVSELSGGQRQRVAIARALAVEPSVLLLDEPLSALDLKLRQHMRKELRDIQQRVGITFIYITHDQGEALTMSDRIAVMNGGVIEQVGDGRSIYNEPRTPFVASFVGENNALTGRLVSADGQLGTLDSAQGQLSARNPLNLPAGAAATLFVRPERLHPGTHPQFPMITGVVQDISFEGHMTHQRLRCADGLILSLSLPASSAQTCRSTGESMTVHFDPMHACLLPDNVAQGSSE